MRAFLSYSLNNRDQYILTLLAHELKKRGFVINQSIDFNSKMSSLTKININKSQLFIGLFTGDGKENSRIQKEWLLASIADIPSILLVEKNIEINADFRIPYITFDRNNPKLIIDTLKSKVDLIKKKKKQDSNTWAWILGGAAVLAIIGLLSNDD
jgi:hypothetical protein